MKSRLFQTSILLLFVSVFAHGQQSVQGKILDERNKPIADAYVVHLASEHHAHTNAFGVFLLHGVKSGDTLQITHIGYETEYFVLENDFKTIEIVLEDRPFELEEVIVGQGIKTLDAISRYDIEINPVTSSQEVLQKVPGLFIGQHAGGGKAEQIFLRGFDIDHGTDINLTVDNIPVNMVSHAHGQGYSDLHFLIPETIDKIDFDKGPYNGTKGNFATAGYVNFQTKEKLDENLVTVEAGMFNTLRTVGLFNLSNSETTNAYLAMEHLSSDGPFESSQDFDRLNVMGKFSTQMANFNKLEIMVSHFESSWNASGQIPVRAVQDGSISRFGAIDDTEGGFTGRTNIGATMYHFVNDQMFVKSNAFYSVYDFELYSNFTFFLNDPANGDQIRQKENRAIFGFESQWNYETEWGQTPTHIQAAVGLRNDVVNDVELSETSNRQTTQANIQLGDVKETNYFSYLNVEFDKGALLINPAIRVDYFNYYYVNQLEPTFNPRSLSKAIVSPKLNFIYDINQSTQVFFKTGIGFHSNDTRVVLDQNSVSDVLPAAYGADLGATWKPYPKLLLNGALWYLELEQEFVYVGDAGIVEPSGRTRRQGVDIGVRYQLADWLFLSTDFNYSHARSLEDPEGENRIPLAPIITSTGSATIKKGRFNGALKYRYIQDRPANEDNSIVAEGYTVFDFNMNYSVKAWTLGVAVQNLFDVEWNETQFATESRLNGEASSVEEIHFTPGTPFNLRGSITYKF